MRILFLLVCNLGLLVFSGTAIAEHIKEISIPKGGMLSQTVEKCTMPKGTKFAIVHFRFGPVPVVAANDTRITIIKVKRNIPHRDDLSDKRDVAIFSVSYDKPSLVSPQGKIFPYMEYRSQLATDDGFVFYDVLKNCSKT